MEDKLFMLTVHQLQGYSKGTPNINAATVKQAGQGHTHPCTPVQLHLGQRRTVSCGPEHLPDTFHHGRGHRVPCRPMLPFTFHHGQGHTVSCSQNIFIISIKGSSHCEAGWPRTHAPLHASSTTPRPETHSLLTASTPSTTVRDTQSLAGQYNFEALSTTVRDKQSLADYYTHSPSTTARDTQPLAQTSSTTSECFLQ